MSRDGWEWRANWFVHKTIKDLDNRKYCSKSDYCFFINVRKRNMSPVISKAYYYRLDVYYSRDRPSANKPRLVWKNTVWKNSVWKIHIVKIHFRKMHSWKIHFGKSENCWASVAFRQYMTSPAKNGIRDACSTADISDCPRHAFRWCPRHAFRWCPRHAQDDSPDMPQMMPQTCPGWCPRHTPDMPQICPRHAPDDAPDMLQRWCPRQCPRHAPDDAPDNAQDMPQIMPQTCPRWCPIPMYLLVSYSGCTWLYLAVSGCT